MRNFKMRKWLLCFVIFTTILLVACVCHAEGGNIQDIPQKIVDLLAEKGIEKQYIKDYVSLDVVEAPKPLRHLFVMVSQDGTHHTVYHFTNSETDENAYMRWEYKTKYDSLAPQGKGAVFFIKHSPYDRYGYNSDVQLYDDSNGFLIYRIDPDYEEYYMQGINIHVIDKQFRIVAWFDRNAAPNCSTYVKNGQIYYGNNDTGKKYGSVSLYRTLDLNVSFSSLPKTYEKAVEKYTDPAKIPAGKLKAELIRFTSGNKYAVYSAPDKNSYRASNGKAAVSTNDWIQVFGQENGWILIQYAINNEHYRFGYIPANALPKKASVKQLDFDQTIAYTVQTTAITDDPLYSSTPIITLPEGCSVTWLATMGDWAYTEYQSTDHAQRIRGFICASSLRLLSSEQACSLAENALLAFRSAAELQPVSREVLQNYSIIAAYDSNNSMWSVRFDSASDYGYTVFVNDKTEATWVDHADNDQ